MIDYPDGWDDGREQKLFDELAAYITDTYGPPCNEGDPWPSQFCVPCWAWTYYHNLIELSNCDTDEGETDE